jgi:protease PrsW
MTTSQHGSADAGRSDGTATAPGAPFGAPAAGTLFFSCLAGPDRGKRLALAEGYFTFGSSAECNLLSDDPGVGRRHAVIAVEHGQLSIQPLEDNAVFLDGHRLVLSTLIGPTQQVRFGRSLWQLGEPKPVGQGGEGFAGFIERMSDRVSSVAGLEKIHGFNARQMFSEVFKRRPDEEKEEYFNVGTRTTTPHITQVDTNWPKPWAFARTLGATALAYALLLWAWREFSNPYFVPALIVIGSMAFPFAILVFFFEVNVPRNISLYQIIRMVLFGGIISLIVSLFGFRYTNLSNWLGAMSAGIVEELGKMLTLLLFVGNRRFKWTLNGLLIGAAVGTGFSVFETMGYVFDALWNHGSQAMLSEITGRGWLVVLGDHSLWTGLVGAALWRVRGDRPFRPDMLGDPRFLRVLGIAMAMHMVNNAPIRVPLYAKFFLIGFVAWAAILSFIQDGLRQVRQEQIEIAKRNGIEVTGEIPVAG